MTGHDGEPVVAIKGYCAREEFVHDNSPGVDVASRIAPASLCLFRAHVVRGPKLFGYMAPGKATGR